jgi:hypothetical protein
VTVPPAVTLETIKREVESVAGFAAAAGVTLDASALSESNLSFRVVFRNAKGDRFYAEFDCRDFPLYPPTVEFTDAAGAVRGLAGLYPGGFHTMPCVCMRYNRKAYGDRGGPHGDWRLIDWHLATPGGGAIDSLPMIVSDLHSKIVQSTGRLG